MLEKRGTEKVHGIVGHHKQFSVVKTKCEIRTGRQSEQEREERRKAREAGRSELVGQRN